MLEWINFEKKFGVESRIAFEELSYFLFCKQLNLTEGITKRVNQAYIEADPVKIENELIGFQAKYYDATTKLSDRASDLIESIKGAAKKYQGISRIFFYVNKELTDSTHDNTFIPDYQKRIEEYAGTYNIEINWYTLSKIEYLLRKPECRYIHDYFFQLKSDVAENLIDYYNYVERRYNSPDKEEQLVGSGSLCDTYIEAYYVDPKDNSKRFSVIKELESWCVSSIGKICIIHGQPGHGKTSLCIHAVSGFYKDTLFQKYDYQAIGSQLTGNSGKRIVHLGTTVDNVFWFSINPLIVKDIIDTQSQSVELSKSFCWGVEGENKFFTFNVSALRNSLIFLDGYDELIYKAAQVTRTRHLRDFLYKVKNYAEEYNIHFVITARSASIEYELENIADDMTIKVMRLDCISKDQQVEWMRKQGIEKDYINYISFINDHDLQKLLGVPILFKMIVNNRLYNLNNDNAIGLYDQLFSKTMERHCIPIDDAEDYHQLLESVAYKMFCMNEEEISYTDEKLKSSVGYTYYVEVENILGFYHRSFYQYFLSHYLYNKLVKIKTEENALGFLKQSCYAVIDIEILNKLLELKKLNEELNEKLKEEQIVKNEQIAKKVKIVKKEQIDLLLRLIDETDAIFLVDEKCSGLNRFTMCNYAFYNVLSIASIFGMPLRATEHMRICELLRWYDVRRLVLDNSDLSGNSYSRVNWDGVSIRYSNLNHTNFSFAFLKNAIFNHSYLKNSLLINSIVKNADMIQVDMTEANLYRTDFSGTNLSNAIFHKSTCIYSIFKNADLSKAAFSDIEFTHVDFTRARLSETSFCRCIVPQCEFDGARLSGVKFYESILSNISLNRANLVGVKFHKCELNEVAFIGAYAIENSYENSTINGGSFKYADLRGTIFSNDYIKDVDFSGSDIRGVIFENSVIINCYFTITDIDNYYFGTKIDEETTWRGVKIYIDFQSEQYNETKKFFERNSVELYDINKSNVL